MEVNIHEAKTHLSRLIERAVAGEDITIAKAGHPILGSARGTFVLNDSWDKPLTIGELEELFGK